MIVFGDANFASDTDAQKPDQIGLNVILTTLAWCQGKPELDSGDVPPKERKAYKLTMKDDAINRIIWLPPFWLLLSVLILGVGVAVLRRS